MATITHDKEIKIDYDACDMKLAVMQYFRTKRNFFAATEVNIGYGIADVLVLDKRGMYYEIEVKISKYDLLKDIETKEHKHRQYELLNKGELIPNKFYYCVPIELESIAHEFINSHNVKYGLIRFSFKKRWDRDWMPFLGGYVSIARTAKLLSKEPGEYLKHAMIMRLCNENIRLREKEFQRKYFPQNK